jgi:hypothetical protein
MLNKLIALTALSAGASAKGISPEMKKNLSNLQRDGIAADSSFGRHLINKSRRVEQQGQENDISFVSNYSIKFLGCHHVTQWASEEEQEEMEENNNQQEEEMTLNAANGRIRSKGLVRFRLCPSDSCFDHFGVGCSSNYGEYVVDMYSFLEVYIAWQMENAQYQCKTYQNTCYKQCYESSSANCYSSCYKKYGVDAALCSNQDGNGNYNDGYGNQFSLEDYLQCAEYELANYDNEQDIVHYLGPYCANQGGDIRLGFFQDQYCAIPSAYQANYFEKLTGVEVPYTKQSIVNTNCMSCEATQQEQEAQNANGNDYYNYDADGNRNYYVATEVNDLCGTMYMQSGKCETQFSKDDVPYPEEGACTYIESVKRLKNDGIIRSDQKISSKPASIAIGVFTGLAVLLGGYVYYLKSKISRSRVNLAGATTSLA